MLHFQTTVIFKLESINSPFLRDLKKNLLKILRMKSTATKKLKESRTDVNINISRFSTCHTVEMRPLFYLCTHLSPDHQKVETKNLLYAHLYKYTCQSSLASAFIQMGIEKIFVFLLSGDKCIQR